VDSEASAPEESGNGWERVSTSGPEYALYIRNCQIPSANAFLSFSLNNCGYNVPIIPSQPGITVRKNLHFYAFATAGGHLWKRRNFL